RPVGPPHVARGIDQLTVDIPIVRQKRERVVDRAVPEGRASPVIGRSGPAVYEPVRGDRLDHQADLVGVGYEHSLRAFATETPYEVANLRLLHLDACCSPTSGEVLLDAVFLSAGTRQIGQGDREFG